MQLWQPLAVGLKPCWMLGRESRKASQLKHPGPLCLAHHQGHDLGHVAWPLCTSFISSIKMKLTSVPTQVNVKGKCF